MRRLVILGAPPGTVPADSHHAIVAQAVSMVQVVACDNTVVSY